MILGFVAVFGCLVNIFFLQRSGAMLPLLLIGLLMLRGDKLYVRFVRSLTLVGLPVADEI